MSRLDTILEFARQTDRIAISILRVFCCANAIKKQISLYLDLTVLIILFAIFVAQCNVSVEYFVFSS